MAEQKPAESNAEQPAKKGLPLVPIIIVASVMLVEAVVIGGIFMMAGGPTEVKAESALQSDLDKLEEPVELLVVADKFQNTKTGQRFLYDTEVWVVSKAKHRERIEALATEMKASIQSDVNVIFRRAEPSHLQEAELSTLTRQIKQALMERFGNNADGEPLLTDVIIGKCTEFSADY
jgi:flagellar basal body-associated protein FliL